MKLNNKIKSALGYVIALAIALSAGVIYKQLTKPTPEEIRHEAITKIVKTINAESQKYNYPIKIDEETQLDGMRATRDAIFYKYTLHHKGQITQNELHQIRQRVKKAVCSDKTMRQVMRLGLVYLYEYYTPKGYKWFTAVVSISDCKR